MQCSARSHSAAHKRDAPPSQVVQSYAIDNEGIAFSCRKGGETTADLSATSQQSTLDTIRGVYGSTLAKELLKMEVHAGSSAPPPARRTALLRPGQGHPCARWRRATDWPRA